MHRLHCVLAVLLYCFVGPAWADDLPMQAPGDIWELKDTAFLRFTAEADSELVRRVLDLPISDDFGDAETARVALYILRRTREGALLQSYMENDVVAELVGESRAGARTVREAIAQQAAHPDANVRSRLQDAFHAALKLGGGVSASGRVYMARRKLTIGTDGISFGYPANTNDSPRSKAHRLVRSSSCIERNSCGFRDVLEFFGEHNVARRAADAGVIAAYALLLFGGSTLVLRKRTASRRTMSLARLSLLPAGFHLLYISYVIFSVDVRQGEGAAAGVVIVGFIQFAAGVVCGLLALGLFFASVPRANPIDR